MNHLRRVAPAAYLLAVILIVFTVMDLAQTVLPIHLGDVQWRVGAVGLLSRMMITPLLGLVVAYAVALLAEHRRVLRTMAVLDGLFVLVLLVGLAFYALDALELRARLTEGSRNYDLGISFSFVKYLFGLVILVVMTIGPWRAATGIRKGGRRQGAESPTAVVFGRGEKGDRGTPARTAPASREAEPVQEV